MSSRSELENKKQEHMLGGDKTSGRSTCLNMTDGLRSESHLSSSTKSVALLGGYLLAYLQNLKFSNDYSKLQ